MVNLIPYPKQPYNFNLAKAAVYELIQQDPMTMSWAIEKIAKSKSTSTSFIYLQNIIPPDCFYISQHYKETNQDRVFLNRKDFICKRLVQFLLWAKDSKAKNLEEIDGDDYEIHLDQISIRDINLVQLLIDKFTNHIVPHEDYLKIEETESVVSSTKSDQAEGNSKSITKSLFSKPFSKQSLKGPSTDNLSDNGAKNKVKNYNLPYSYSANGGYTSKIFIREYDNAATQDGWTDKEKLEHFHDHLKGQALDWYSIIAPYIGKDWKSLRQSFERDFVGY
ncbi:hypothetical protein CONCODRAFT_10369 [Conidiobolus coronatus NRRL 28638]|uniref:Retrotransposon gag domain-containing protein n=1 Tax=Conidiobolus coronatus (strain ATCC 28846 / CBS 209.66 / NRRL 28638) TaxID=796925 RepID=A0A137NXY3_CONC2|nr:hypothetical protein CONCODRAFT_10369 [Conidiobolus coronatus NRRL 28638]|eukprot:KXN67538.1 hypothetical protein CONCODRAFT_10369 [Conidiobolus coronatus NRRL 28638]